MLLADLLSGWFFLSKLLILMKLVWAELYSSVWEQVARLVSPLPPPQDHPAQSSNHAADCDDSLGYEYPFVLKA
jgi:hypothetical protein